MLELIIQSFNLPDNFAWGSVWHHSWVNVRQAYLVLRCGKILSFSVASVGSCATVEVS